jgi:hypothetical protein
MAPNYQGDRDAIRGFLRSFKGQVVELILYKLGEGDFQAELSRVRAMNPQDVFVFAPGATRRPFHHWPLHVNGGRFMP